MGSQGQNVAIFQGNQLIVGAGGNVDLQLFTGKADLGGQFNKKMLLLVKALKLRNNKQMCTVGVHNICLSTLNL